MPVIQFKGKSVIETYHHTVPHHRLEFVPVYNDNLTQPQFKEWIGQIVGKEGEDATRRDKWCCVMYPRLGISSLISRQPAPSRGSNAA